MILSRVSIELDRKEVATVSKVIFSEIPIIMLC